MTEPSHETEGNASIELVAWAIAKGTQPDDTLVRDVASACLKAEPTATYEEIAHFVDVKVNQAFSMKSVRNLPGFLVTAVPRCFEGVSFASYRREVRERAEGAAARQRRRDAEMEQFRQGQEAILAVAPLNGGSPSLCQRCSGSGFMFDDTGTEQVAGEEFKTVAASACNCAKGGEIRYGQLAVIERREAERRGLGWIPAHRHFDHMANANTALSLAGT